MPSLVQLLGGGSSSDSGVSSPPAAEARSINVEPILNGSNAVGLVSGLGSGHTASSPQHFYSSSVQPTPRPPGETAVLNPAGINIRKNLPYFQLLSVIEKPGTVQPSFYPPLWVILLLIPALDYYPLRDPFPDLINPDLAVLSSGLLILVRELLSSGPARTAAAPLPSTISLAEATAMLLPVIPQRYEGDLDRKLARILDSSSWFYSAADALPDLFALAAFFGSNNKLDPSQIVDFLKWIMTHNHTEHFTLFMATRVPTVNAFATVAVESAIRVKSVQTLEILFECRVKLDDMLDRIALLDGAGKLTQSILSGMNLASLVATGVGTNLSHHFFETGQYDLLRTLAEKGVRVQDLRAHDGRSSLYHPVMRKDVAGTNLQDRLGLGSAEVLDAGGSILAGVVDPTGRSNAALAVGHVAGGCEQRTAHQLEQALEESIRGNDLAAATVLLQNGADPNGRTLNTRPLKAAMQSSVTDQGFIQLLLKHGADPNKPGLLGAVVETGRSDLLEMFLARPIKLEQRMSALIIASRAGNIASAAMLIKTPGMDIDTRGFRFNPLQSAAGAGTDRGLGMVVFLLEKGANVNAPADPLGGRTALQAALESAPTFEIAETLLRYGADAAAPPAKADGLTALEALCNNTYARDHSKLIDKLLAAGATVNRPGGRPSSVIHGVVKNGMHAILRRFFESGHCASLHHMWHDKADSKWGPHSPVQLAASLGDLEAVKVLVSLGANVNQSPHYCFGRTALQGAADLRKLGRDKMRLVRYLLDCGADVNASPATVGGFTALQGAARAGDLFLVSFLIDRGADVNAPPPFSCGLSALDVAAKTGNILLAELLIARGAHANTPPVGLHDCTAVELAAEHGRLDMVKLLLNAGATGSRSLPGEEPLGSAIRVAVKAGHPAIVRILNEERAKRQGRVPPGQ